MLKTRCIVDGIKTAKVWFISGHAFKEFLKINPMLFITPLTKMLQSSPVTVAMTATPLEELTQVSAIMFQNDKWIYSLKMNLFHYYPAIW